MTREEGGGGADLFLFYQQVSSALSREVQRYYRTDRDTIGKKEVQQLVKRSHRVTLKMTAHVAAMTPHVAGGCFTGSERAVS